MKEKEIPKGYKKTEVGIIPEDWEVKKLKDIGVIKTGGTPSTSIKKFWNGNIIWVTPTDINERKEIRQTERKISEEGLKIVGELPPNTVLVTCIASIGKNAIIKERGACNQQINAIIPSKNYDTDFLYYLMENNSKKLLARAGITATLIISKKEFSQLLFAFPPSIEEQQTIANVLSDFDKLIESLDKLIEKKKNIKKGTMQLLLTGKKRLPGFTGEWVSKKLGEISIKMKSGGTPSKSIKEFWNGRIPFVLIEDMTNTGKYLYHTKEKITEKGLIHSSAWIVPLNSLLISMYASLGEVVINKVEVTTSQAILALIPDKKYDLEFLYYILSFVKGKFESHSAQTTQKNLSKQILQKFEIPFPPTIEEQRAIAQILSDMDAEIEALEKKKQKYEMMKKAAMELLLTGKIRLKEYVERVSI